MLAVIACLVGVLYILITAEILWRRGVLEGENMRKFVHIGAGSFVAFWPWFLDWRTIQIIGLIMLAVILLNRRDEVLHFSAGLRRDSAGGISLALAIVICAMLTQDKVFFALAILHLAVADGMAAVIGTDFGKRWAYKVFSQTKTVLGTMAFWITSLFILGVGLLFVDQIDLREYTLLVILMPPALTAIENLTVKGLDNLTIPLAALLILRAVA